MEVVLLDVFDKDVNSGTAMHRLNVIQRFLGALVNYSPAHVDPWRF